MEKRFKNKVAFTGPIVLREAMVKELIKKGYLKADWSLNCFETNPVTINSWKKGILQNVSGAVGSTTYSLPEQWNECYAAAIEEESIPEYVECMVSFWSGFTKGKIYKVDSKGLPNPYNCGGTNTVIHYTVNSSRTYAGDFIPSTKKAFDKQERVIPEYVEIIKGKEGRNYDSWNGQTDEVNSHYNREYRIHKVVKFTYIRGGKSLLQDAAGNYSAFEIEACRPSTLEEYLKEKEEVRIAKLVEEGGKRYPANTLIDSAYSGLRTITRHFPIYGILDGKDCLRANGKNAIIYYDGVWATIIAEYDVSPIKYVKCIKSSSNNFIKGKIYQVEKEEGQPIKNRIQLIGENTKTPYHYPLNGSLWAFEYVDSKDSDVPLEIEGRKVEVSKQGTVSIGCYGEITRKQLEAFRTVMEFGKKRDLAFSISPGLIMDCNDNKIDYSDLNKIIKLLDFKSC